MPTRFDPDQRRDHLLLSKVSRRDAARIRTAAAASDSTVSTYLRDRALSEVEPRI